MVVWGGGAGWVGGWVVDVIMEVEGVPIAADESIPFRYGLMGSGPCSIRPLLR